MSLKSIRWGIDLGTTNSAIACLSGDRVEVQSDRWGNRIIPSAVAFRPDIEPPEELTGRFARNLVAVHHKSVIQRFKRYMGDPEWKHEFPGTGIRENASELSARVLRAVSAAAISTGSLGAAVITVPAAFDKPQVEDTRRAAELAGIRHVELLQEPVAAALAFAHALGASGVHTWLAYDLGGGTFDAALIRGEDGTFSVIDHEGHGYLGGSNLDEAIVREFVLPRLPERVQEAVGREDSTHKQVLLSAAEIEKCRLARQERVGINVEIGDFHDLVPLTRRDLAFFEAKLFRQTLDMCRTLLARNGLTPSDIERVLLIGGPTLSPSLRVMIATGWGGDGSSLPVDGLGIPLDSSVDPLTAVAIGAAHFAAGLTYEAEPDETDEVAAVRVEMPGLTIETSEEDLLLAGRVAPQVGHNIAPGSGWSIRLLRLAGGGVAAALREDSAALKDGGGFSLRLPLDAGENLFQIEVVDPSGIGVAVTPPNIRLVRSIVRTVPRTLLRGIGIADHTGKTIWLVPRGKPLPATSDPADGIFYTTRALEPGEAGEVLSIPILEGNEVKAHLNRTIYKLEIRSDRVDRSIPQHSQVEILVSVGASAEEVKIAPRLQSYDLPLDPVVLSLTVTVEEVGGNLENLLHDLRLLQEAAVDDDEIAAMLAHITEEGDVGRIQEKLARAGRDSAVVRAARTDLELLQRKIDPYVERLDHLLPWRKHRERCDGNMSAAAAIVEETRGLPQAWLDRLDELTRRYVAAIEERDEELSERIAFGELPELFKEDEQLRTRVRDAGNGPVTIETRRTGHLLKGDVQQGLETV